MAVPFKERIDIFLADRFGILADAPEQAFSQAHYMTAEIFVE